MIMEGKAANAIGGKTARACDSCLKKRARWFCSADDAFLCQSCDTFVHSANQLASRHDRVRLESSSSAFRAKTRPGDGEHVPKWHLGFTRKARTPRNHAKTKLQNSSSHSLVPEISGDDEVSPFDNNESEEQIRVPVFEPFSHDELCNELNDILNNDHEDDGCGIPEFINASDAEIADFAADVESLLGTRIDGDGDGVYDGMEALEFELGERKNEDDHHHDAWTEEKSRVKIEDHDQDDHEEVEAVIACHFDPALDMARESLSWDDHFHYSMSPLRPHEEEVKGINHEYSVPMKMDINIIHHDESSKDHQEAKTDMFLKLNYETVITAWDGQGSPWADGVKPELNPGDFWPDFLSSSPRDVHENPFGAGAGRFGGRDEEREARVLRYREKRRTRLFSKKIRYEVRKLNAEKRPRMKGRFVKRTSFAGHQSFPNNFRSKS